MQNNEQGQRNNMIIKSKGNETKNKDNEMRETVNWTKQSKEKKTLEKKTRHLIKNKTKLDQEKETLKKKKKKKATRKAPHGLRQALRIILWLTTSNFIRRRKSSV